MIFGSVCSGIEAATQAWGPLGWSPAFYSEIERFPSAVLAHHYGSNMPGQPWSTNATPNYGDMTKFEEWPDHGPVSERPIDILCGGTPCQSFSIAGLRKGLDDQRGNLSLTFGAIARRYRPPWMVWENVCGVLSSDRGRDFASILGLLSGRKITPPADGWKNAGYIESIPNAYGLAWRVLDAQYIRVDGFERAVPQRRRRVVLVGYSGDWRRAAAVLFEAESLSGNPPPRRQAGKGIAPTISVRPTGGGGLGTDFDLDGGLIAADMLAIGEYGNGETASTMKARDFKDATDLVAHSLRGEGFDASEDGTGRGTPLVPITITERGRKGGQNLEWRQDGTANTILTPNGGRGGMGVGAVAFAQNTRDEVRYINGDGQIVGALGAETGMKQQNYLATHDVAGTMESRQTSGGFSNSIDHAAAGYMALNKQSYAVRRLTPVECERLMGFPDGFTQIPWRGKDPENCPDGPRYKALGNSWAVNMFAWVGQRINTIQKMIDEGTI